jgi:hypothetical protein
VTTAPRTYRESDGEALPMEDAKTAWVAEARVVLEEVAGKYNALITYAEFSEQLQSRTGVRTRIRTQRWIDDVLATVGADCVEHKEPVLSALCVMADGTIGVGYGEALGDDAPADLDMDAAEQRLECYRLYGATMPADGGRPTLSPKVAARRSLIARRNRDEVVRPTCPTCHLALPATGHCDRCAS